MALLFHRLCQQETELWSVLKELPVENKGCRQMGEQKEPEHQYQALQLVLVSAQLHPSSTELVMHTRGTEGGIWREIK